MNSKIFIIVLINAIWAFIPQNIIGCGPQADPKDYYISFFTNAHIPDQTFRPFFYTALLKFYDEYDWDWEEKEAKKRGPDPLILEWQNYVGNNLTAKQVEDFVYNAPAEVVQYMMLTAEGKEPVPPAEYNKFRANPMPTALFKIGKKEALQYLLLAKQLQPLIYNEDPWEVAIEKDSVKLIGMYKNAETNLKLAKDGFIQTKYGFMLCRTAFYARNHSLCLKAADNFLATTSPDNALITNVMSYKAGCFFRTGRNAEAALWYARAFKNSPGKRKKEFLSFLWSTKEAEQSIQPAVIALGADNEEKAYLAGLFSIYGLDYGLENMKLAYSLDPMCTLLPVLAVREIKKLEEHYLSPVLAAQKGAREIFYLPPAKESARNLEHAENMLAFFEKLAANKNLIRNDFYKLAAAYTAYICGKHEKAAQWANLSAETSLPLKNQALLINLLSSISKAPRLNAETEAKLLTPLRALYAVAEKEMDYRVFMRNLYEQVMAPKYFEQGDIHKTALCIAVANLGHMPELKEEEYPYGVYSEPALYYVRSQFSTKEAIKLHDFLKDPKLSDYDKFLASKSSFNSNDIADFIGTSYLRDHAWKQAIEWLEKQEQEASLIGMAFNQKDYTDDSIFVNPFYDYINDWQRFEKGLSKPMTKTSLAYKMMSLEMQFDTTTVKLQKGKIAYTLGAAYYNLSYYGNAWMVLDYYRPSVLWNNGKQTGWRKEYFEVRKAKMYFENAYMLSGGNKEFQAAAFFLMAKCVQRQIPKPDFDFDHWDDYRKAEKEFEKKFINNPLFPQFKNEFGATKYYKYALARCSYLADFNKRN